MRHSPCVARIAHARPLGTSIAPASHRCLCVSRCCLAFRLPVPVAAPDGGANSVPLHALDPMGGRVYHLSASSPLAEPRASVHTRIQSESSSTSARRLCVNCAVPRIHTEQTHRTLCLDHSSLRVLLCRVERLAEFARRIATSRGSCRSRDQHPRLTTSLCALLRRMDFVYLVVATLSGDRCPPCSVAPSWPLSTCESE